MSLRPAYSEILQRVRGEKVTCSCGELIQSYTALHDHWERGHFDTDCQTKMTRASEPVHIFKIHRIGAVEPPTITEQHSYLHPLDAIEWCGTWEIHSVIGLQSEFCIGVIWRRYRWAQCSE